MIVTREGNIILINHEKGSVIEFVRKIEDNFNNYKNDNIVVQLTSLDGLTSADVVEFLSICKQHKASNKSFVLVSNNIEIDDVPDEITLVPTLREAFDMIEMEDMERDLGI